MNAEEYRRPAPRLPAPQAKEWLAFSKRGVGGWAFLLHRLTGLVLVFYLFLHLAVLSALARGPQAYQAMLAFMDSPLIVALEVGLIATIAFHALNGIRLVLMGFGVGVRAHKALFWVAFVLAAGLTALAALAMF